MFQLVVRRDGLGAGDALCFSWSFGVTISELVTLGGTPYPTIANRDLLQELRRGYRMERPDNCTDEL